MPCTIGRKWPTLVVTIVGLQHNSTRGLSKSNGTVIVRECPGPGPQDFPWSSGEIIRGSRNHEKLSSSETDPIGEVVIHISSQFPTGQIDADRAGVVKFDEFPGAIRITSGMVVNLRKNHTGPTAARSREDLSFDRHWNQRTKNQKRPKKLREKSGERIETRGRNKEFPSILKLSTSSPAKSVPWIVAAFFVFIAQDPVFFEIAPKSFMSPFSSSSATRAPAPFPEPFQWPDGPHPKSVRLRQSHPAFFQARDRFV